MVTLFNSLNTCVMNKIVLSYLGCNRCHYGKLYRCPKGYLLGLCIMFNNNIVKHKYGMAMVASFFPLGRVCLQVFNLKFF